MHGDPFEAGFTQELLDVPRRVQVEALGPAGVHLTGEALDGVLGAHELLEQVDAEVG
jgi:hypothetical protein